MKIEHLKPGHTGLVWSPAQKDYVPVEIIKIHKSSISTVHGKMDPRNIIATGVDP